MDTPPLVSIITINYDHPEVTCEMLESLRSITYPNIEVIVVDNASPNDDPSVIYKNYPEVIFLQSDENLGFAGGNNLGLRKARGKYILFLNNDTEVDPGFLEPMVKKFEEDPTVGAVSPKIRFFHTPDTIQFSGITEFNPYTIRNRGLGYGQKDEGQFDRDAITAYAHGAAMMVPVKIIREVGMMAECYFLYYEEHDWASRIRKAGYKIWYIHNSLILHKESISTVKMSPLKIYYINRARIMFMRRNIHGLVFIISILYQVLVSIPKNALFFLVKGKTGHFSAYVRAVGWHIRHLISPALHQNPIL
jgi:GT2 family glycosyltransferase